MLTIQIGCEKKNDGIIDSQSSAPQLLTAEIRPNTVNTDTISAGPNAKPEDVLKIGIALTARVSIAPGSTSPITVSYSIKRQFQSSELTAGNLSDAGGGNHVGTAAVEIKRSEVGILYVDFQAQSELGYRSTSIVLPLQIVRLNRPPIVSNLQAPDTVTLRNVDQLLRLKIKAVDPDGQEDIQRVIFNSFLPDGRASTGNPFQMFDDGNTQTSGDELRGDSVYTRLVLLPANTTTGTYRFEFQAFDRLNEGSNVIIHRLTVRP